MIKSIETLPANGQRMTVNLRHAGEQGSHRCCLGALGGTGITIGVADLQIVATPARAGGRASGPL